MKESTTKNNKIIRNLNRFFTLVQTEFSLSLRSLDIVLFGLMMPVAIIIIIGLIYGGKNSGGTEMIQRTFGSYIAIGICAVGLMGLPLTLSDYRQKKVLKRLAVTPAHPGLLLGVQLFVQGLVAIFSGILVTITAYLFFGYVLDGNPVTMLLSYMLVLISIFSIGLCIASVASDIKKAGLICSVLYFPMLLLSGTTVPFHVFPKSIQKAAAVLPLTQGIKLLNSVSLGEPIFLQLPKVLVLSAIAVTCLIVSVKTFRWDMEK